MGIVIQKSFIQHSIVLKIAIASTAIVVGLAAVLLSGQLTTRVKADAINTTDFVITVKTDNLSTGSSGATQFRIPTTGTGYNYTVDCNNDGVVDASGQTGSYTCNYATAGTYTVRIGGTFPRIYFANNNANDRLKLLQINQWGTGIWASMQSAFYGTANMDVVATDTPNLTSATSLSTMFTGTTNLIGENASWNWETSSIADMSSMFSGATNFN